MITLMLKTACGCQRMIRNQTEAPKIFTLALKQDFELDIRLRHFKRKRREGWIWYYEEVLE